MLPSASAARTRKVCLRSPLSFLYLAGLVQGTNSAPLPSRHSKLAPSSAKNLNLASEDLDFFGGLLTIVGGAGPVVSTANACVAVLDWLK